MDMKHSYQYPDRDDRITAHFIEQSEPYTGYWNLSELRAFNLAVRRLERILGTRKHITALDAGCGQGRLLPLLTQLAGEITGVDPDPDRLAVARKQAEYLQTRKLNFELSAIADFSSKPFDLVVCSHVIQHVSTSEVIPLLERLHRLTTPTGVLLLSYARAPVGQESFSVTRLKEGRVQSYPVSSEQFDATVHQPAPGGDLPVHFVDPLELTEQARGIGWTEDWNWTYHIIDDLGDIDDRVDRDKVVNSFYPLWKNLGRDLMTLWRHQLPDSPAVTR